MTRAAASMALVSVWLGGTTPVWACATCLDGAWGNRVFNVAFVGLMLAPFAVVAGVGGALAWWARSRRAAVRSGDCQRGRSRVTRSR